MSHWFIIEPNLTGHRIKYLQELTEAALRAQHSVTVAVAQRASNHDVVHSRDLPQGPDLKYCFVAMPTDHACYGHVIHDLRREFAYWCFAKQAFSETQSLHPIDAVLIPYFDYCMNACALLGLPWRTQAPVYGIVMRPTFHFPTMGVRAPTVRLRRLREALFHRALGHPQTAALLTIDPTLHQYARQQGHSAPEAAWNKLRYLPDPVERQPPVPCAQARTILGLSPHARVILAYGALDARKGLSTLLESLQHPQAPSDVHLLLAGRLSDDFRATLAAPWAQDLMTQHRLHIHDRRIADHEEPVFFGAANAVWLGYHQHYTMSGVLLKAGRFGRPVLASPSGLIAWMAARMPQALLLPTGDVTDLAPALHRIPAATALETEADFFPQHDWSCALTQALPELSAPAQGLRAESV